MMLCAFLAVVDLRLKHYFRMKSFKVKLIFIKMMMKAKNWRSVIKQTKETKTEKVTQFPSNSKEMSDTKKNHDKYFNLTARETDNWINPLDIKIQRENKSKRNLFARRYSSSKDEEKTHFHIFCILNG